MPAPASACRPSACNWSRHLRAVSTWPRASRACPRSTMAATCSTWSSTCNPRWSASAAHNRSRQLMVPMSPRSHPNRLPPTPGRLGPAPSWPARRCLLDEPDGPPAPTFKHRTLRSRRDAAARVLSAHADRRRGGCARDAPCPLRRATPGSPSPLGSDPVQVTRLGPLLGSRRVRLWTLTVAGQSVLDARRRLAPAAACAHLPYGAPERWPEAVHQRDLPMQVATYQLLAQAVGDLPQPVRIAAWEHPWIRTLTATESGRCRHVRLP